MVRNPEEKPEEEVERRKKIVLETYRAFREAVTPKREEKGGK